MTTPYDERPDLAEIRELTEAEGGADDAPARETPWRPAGFEERQGPPDDRRCSAKSKTSGERCKLWAIRGGTVCRHHGGAAKQVREKANRRLAAEKAEQDAHDALAYHMPEGITDPFEALSQLAAEALELKDALGSRVNALKRLRYSAHGAGTEQIRGEIQLYERAMDRAGKLVKLLLDAGFEERRTSMSEQQGALLATAVRAILARLDLDERQQELVSTVVPEVFRQINRGEIEAKGDR